MTSVTWGFWQHRDSAGIVRLHEPGRAGERSDEGGAHPKQAIQHRAWQFTAVLSFRWHPLSIPTVALKHQLD